MTRRNAVSLACRPILLAAFTTLAAAGAESKPQPGLTAEFFGSPRFERSQGTETVSTPDVAGLEKGNDWAARYAGFLNAPAAGEFTFRVEADTGVRLFVDGAPLIDGWQRDGARTGKATLSKNQPIPVVIEFFFDRGQGGKKPLLRLFWTPPGQAEQPVPSSAFSHLGEPVSLVVHGPEQSHVNLSLPDGGLKPLIGVHNIQVFRSTRGKPDLADGDGWTYAHHMDLACWKGRLYAAWAMTPKDEDIPPYKVVYSTSSDGLTWPTPTDLFPRAAAWANRFYFFRASNDRMLALTAGRSGDGAITEAVKKVLLVREITSDHRLGETFTLVNPGPGQPRSYEQAQDAGFVMACREAVAHNLLLEQQDYGVYLGERRMPWHQEKLEVNGWKFGKAFCFYHRLDGAIVGLCKMGFVTLSTDEGKTWSRPTLPSTLVAGGAKVWGQRTADGRFALAYNPDRGRRYPLVLVHSDDGAEFRDMRTVFGEQPRLRYDGKYKDVGAQYTRGLAEWSNDGTFPDSKNALWLIHSVNKEDIWVARIPLPIKPDEKEFPADDFAKTVPDGIVPGWNVYAPRWCRVAIVEEPGTKTRCLELRDGDPFDYAQAVRVFPASANAHLSLSIKPLQSNARLELDLCDAAGRRAVRLALAEDGTLQAYDGKKTIDLGRYEAGRWLTCSMVIRVPDRSCALQFGDATAARQIPLADAACASIERLALRTGSWRGCGHAGAVDAKADVPATPAVFLVKDVVIGPVTAK